MVQFLSCEREAGQEDLTTNLQTASDLIEIERPLSLKADIQVSPRKRRMNYAEIAASSGAKPWR